MDKLVELERDPRVTAIRRGAPDPDGKCIVYWMRRSLRAEDNFSLNAAVKAGNVLGKPIVVFFALLPVSNANLRHYTFLMQGLIGVEEELRGKNVGFVLRRHPEHGVARFCKEVRAALLVTDENPLRGPMSRLEKVTRQLRIPIWSVDSDVVVPSKLIPGKQYAARIIRPKLLKLRDQFLVKPRNPKAKVRWDGKGRSLKVDISALSGLLIERSVQPNTSLRGGTREGLRVLSQFVTKRLKNYPHGRNHPEVVGTSHLSPYLHFGQISPVTAALAVAESRAPQAAKDAFLDQLITWRELCINFVKHNESYDSIECAEPWAQRSLSKHAKDRRPVLYTEKQLENAETYDALWNAAQIQMVQHGWMHNYMRMYWGKKILEWTRSPAEAYQIAVRLNDKYEIDGRDPNGYAGIAWAITGKLDRPWFERPIFGQIRYMSGQSTGRKFDSKDYIAQNPASKQS
jgi:deoxyribodipyrimidine photo-lyase